jgi:hypothetical protein
MFVFNITNLLNFESNVGETMSYWDVTPLQVKPIYMVVPAKKKCVCETAQIHRHNRVMYLNILTVFFAS